MSDVRLIDANRLKRQSVEVDIVTPPHNHYYSELVVFDYDIDDAPTIDAVPVVHGRWVFDRPNHYKCSVCDAMWSGVARFMKFCPNCGAKMRGETDEE